MELSQILERMEQKATKTASAKTEKTAAVSSSAEAVLKQALNEILQTTGTEKTASAWSMSPQEALMKQAELLVGAEKQAEVEHAKMLGLAFADAAITKWAAYDAELKRMAAQEEKVAAQSYYGTMGAAKTKVAEEQKIAAAEYEQGQTQALNEIYQTAASEFLKGAAETNILLQQLAAQK